MLALLLALSPVALAAGPSWTTYNTFQKRGSELLIVCTGQGADLAKARAQAVSSCVQTAAAQLPTVWMVSQDSRETDTDVSLKKQIFADQRIEGLNCDVQNEFLESDDSFTKVWTQCKFDLSKAKSVPLGLEELTTARAITIETKPACHRITIIGGPYARQVPCDGEQTSITLIPGEHMISVYKQGYYIKEIKLEEDIKYQKVTGFLKKIGG